MKTPLQIFISLVLYTLAVAVLIYILILIFNIPLGLADLSLTSLLFMIITGIALVVFIVGNGKLTDDQALYTMGAIGIKFFLSIILALIYFVALKYSSLFYILLFFLLYLAFTIFLLRVIIKSLKTKSLK
jgi:hypothetical protein